MRYVDGFVLVVPKKKLAAYKRMAALGGKMWKKYGALDYKECVGDDLNPNSGGMKTSSFPKMVKLKSNEVVIFSYIVFKSRAHRDSVNKKVMKDPSMSEEAWKDKPMPFDMKRMAFGGFKVIVDIK
ncbi:RNA signal recognition particle [Candidatus Roizmanbacteria bacterium RIFCSPLOWO2_12_FULL_40_12]|uniref:RNA signal recognition particle n=1 Tax=Candidatus Roizmanbacteria bacterium RIFCSPLOWO2_01_FULL_40_42 TaxID=1802066 RepID=A0A1F7J658_9BACT|nr:MAG: RNA signal recognition particle [Candidatus Roizmanbacteria bacterium RIFCSPHIGHO2_01_FULL_40_98]OGK28656.1 MAG: RNA signal recognition particle [Candidatus Roizmanbacteria bacterium RIFCSPHIGHO2_02_FULL_40_53]OGK29438.1 MAG: RNA signal recognition particle [Candidatus Roizmanbacteria bacterium RIFCSPHIGHO2_12_41_18]OGK36640.1 MAG: RNA signal recognition particle [Candidatus Roizmanbacteria bacterium RIFCSPHIGHO2_12_FULL_40_130]OGK51079.1 MAG: RNA signal recognition particle [Candidatus